VIKGSRLERSLISPPPPTQPPGAPNGSLKAARGNEASAKEIGRTRSRLAALDNSPTRDSVPGIRTVPPASRGTSLMLRKISADNDCNNATGAARDARIRRDRTASRNNPACAHARESWLYRIGRYAIYAKIAIPRRRVGDARPSRR